MKAADSDSPAGVGAVLLAAGGSRRLGRPKQLLDWQGEPLVRRAARTLLDSTARPLLAVLGHRADEVEEALAGLEIPCVVNPRWRDGQSASVRAGLEVLGGRCRGLLFVPCDQPHLDSKTLDRLVTAFEEAARDAATAPIVRPRYAGLPGAPVLFPARLFAALGELEGDEGGRQILRRPEAGPVLAVELGDARQGLDLDTDADLEALRALD